jgi:hypothetical protein
MQSTGSALLKGGPHGRKKKGRALPDFIRVAARTAKVVLDLAVGGEATQEEGVRFGHRGF